MAVSKRVYLPMDYLRILCAVVFLAKIGGISALSCSQCESLPGGDCMTSPPPPADCESQNGIEANINCMIARHLDSNGTLVFFSRGCTVVTIGDGCVPHSVNVTLCYQICHYDNCNKGTTLSRTSQLIAFILSHIISLALSNL